MKMLRSLPAPAILLLMLWACTPSSVPTNIPSSPISTSISTGSVPTLVPPTPTPAVTPTSNPHITKITIDGNPLDWSSYPLLVADPAGDQKGGGFDIANVRAFTNNKYLYVLIETHSARKDYVHLDLEILGGTRHFIITFNPESGGQADMGEMTAGQFFHIGEITGSENAAAQAVEFRMPLSAFGGITGFLELNVRPMAGTCCGTDWYAVDDIQPTRIPRRNERELTSAEQFTEWSLAPFTGVASERFVIAEIAGDGTRGLVVNEAETKAYIVGEFMGKLRWVDIDPTSPTFGVSTVLAEDLFILNDIAVNKAETLAYVTRESGPASPVGQNVITRVDLATGQGTMVTAQIGQPSNIVLSRDETTGYVVDLHSGEAGQGGLYRVALGTGVVTPIVTGLDRPFAVAVNRAETIAYVATEPARAGEYPKGNLLRIDISTGEVSAIATGAIHGASGITLSADEKLVVITEFGHEIGCDGKVSVINIDPVSAAFGNKTELVTGLCGAHDVRLNKAETLVYFVEVGSSRLSVIQVNLTPLR